MKSWEAEINKFWRRLEPEQFRYFTWENAWIGYERDIKLHAHRFVDFLKAKHGVKLTFDAAGLGRLNDIIPRLRATKYGRDLFIGLAGFLAQCVVSILKGEPGGTFVHVGMPEAEYLEVSSAEVSYNPVLEAYRALTEPKHNVREEYARLSRKVSEIRTSWRRLSKDERSRRIQATIRGQRERAEKLRQEVMEALSRLEEVNVDEENHKKPSSYPQYGVGKLDQPGSCCSHGSWLSLFTTHTSSKENEV